MSIYEIITVVISCIALAFSFYNYCKLRPKFIFTFNCCSHNEPPLRFELMVTNMSGAYGEIYKIINISNNEPAQILASQRSNSTFSNPHILIYPFSSSNEFIKFNTAIKIGTKLKIYTTSRKRPFTCVIK